MNTEAAWRSSNILVCAEQQVLDKRHSKAVVATFRRYEVWCKKEQVIAVPLSYKSIAGFCCQHVANNKGSTKSLDNVVSALRTSCRMMKLKWLSEDSHYQLRSVLKVLKFQDLSASKQKRPIQLEMLKKMLGGLDLSKRANLLIAVMLMTGHDGLLRTAELLSGRKVIDLIWNSDRTTFRINFYRSKTYLEGEGFSVPFSDYGEYSAVSLMRRWFDMNNLWHKHEYHLFPTMDRHGRMDFNTTVSANSFRKKLKKKVEAVGLDPTFYSGHSLRAGGATDLFLARVPYYLIKKMRRWKSDAAMKYHRDDEDMERAVCLAFKTGRCN